MASNDKVGKFLNGDRGYIDINIARVVFRASLRRKKYLLKKAKFLRN